MASWSLVATRMRQIFWARVLQRRKVMIWPVVESAGYSCAPVARSYSWRLCCRPRATRETCQHTAVRQTTHGFSHWRRQQPTHYRPSVRSSAAICRITSNQNFCVKGLSVWSYAGKSWQFYFCFISRRNRSCRASHSANSYTFRRSAVCRMLSSVAFVRPV